MAENRHVDDNNTKGKLKHERISVMSIRMDQEMNYEKVSLIFFSDLMMSLRLFSSPGQDITRHTTRLQNLRTWTK